MSDLKESNFDVNTKAPLELLPSKPLRAISSAALDGAVKYGRWNWQKAANREIYKGALMRHVTAFNDPSESDYASDSKVHHLAHAAMCCIILLYIDGVDFHLPASYKDKYSQSGRVKIQKTPNKMTLEV